jgi:hypothetical protein
MMGLMECGPDIQAGAPLQHAAGAMVGYFQTECLVAEKLTLAAYPNETLAREYGVLFLTGIVRVGEYGAAGF